MISSVEGYPTKSKEAPSPHEVRLTPLDTSPVFLCLGEKERRLNSRIKIEEDLIAIKERRLNNRIKEGKKEGLIDVSK